MSVCDYFAFCNYYKAMVWYGYPCLENGEHCKIKEYLRKNLRRVAPINGFYYDLIRVPHGHIPAPLVRLWSRLPLPIKEFRKYDYYHCPICGEPSFFKGVCDDCFFYYPFETDTWYKQTARKEYFRQILKRIECIFLPFLAFFGKAWYVLACKSSSKVKGWLDP